MDWISIVKVNRMILPKVIDKISEKWFIAAAFRLIFRLPPAAL